MALYSTIVYRYGRMVLVLQVDNGQSEQNVGDLKERSFLLNIGEECWGTASIPQLKPKSSHSLFLYFCNFELK